MSDPVTNVEIEDVLSSIRRLVSADDRPNATAQDATETVPEKLVLTPALRVTDAEKPAETALDDKAAALHDEVSEPHVAKEETDGEDETAATDDVSPVQDVWSEDDDDQDDETDSPEDQSESHDDDAANSEAQHQDADISENDATPDAADTPEDGLSAHVAGIEEAVAARDDGWEPDGEGQGDDNAAQPMEALTWQDHDEDEPSDAFVEAADASTSEGLDAFEVEEDDEDELPPELATQEPESAAVNAFFGDDDPLGDDDAILDEEALRDLVTEIVRQELQGSLGERITRNVRKLVRREIHRALATQELE